MAYYVAALIRTSMLACSVLGVISGTLSANVTVNTPISTEGSQATFTCLFSLDENATLTHVSWAFGPVLSTAATIVEWRHDDPNVVHYSHGYSSPVYQMAIAKVTVGKTELTINPVELHDDGRYWCSIRIDGNQTYAFADIQVSDRIVPTVSVYVEGANEVQLGSVVNFYCNYTVSPSDTPLRLGWNYGEQFEVSSSLVDYYFFVTPGEPNPVYFNGNGPPAYEMRYEDIDNGSGGCTTLNIASVSMEDSGRYWCVIELSRGVSTYMEYVDLKVYDVVSNITTPVLEALTTTAVPTTTAADPTTTSGFTSDGVFLNATTKQSLIEVKTTSIDTTSAITTITTIREAESGGMHMKIVIGVILAAVPAVLIVFLGACVIICRCLSKTPTVKTGTADSEKPLPNKGYQDLDKANMSVPNTYRRLILSFSMAAGKIRHSDEPEYEYPQPSPVEMFDKTQWANSDHQYYSPPC